ncbi:cadherin-related family member 3-like [Erpetoichthys calabaricus]|uniref:cadherin-related family member 3-like n=1 Tax=Erpetoichthys calabaricus TaxID=27687 RepID=UPI002233F50E|nr:cadherin-related family member 3-like [Erpetoichthys calabaricus]
MWKRLLVVICLALPSDVFSALTVTVDPLIKTIAENSPGGTSVASINVSVPAGATLNGNPVIVNASPAYHPFFIASSAASQWSVITDSAPILDFEAVPTYRLQILVQDSKGRSASQFITVELSDVNEPPFFTGALALQDAEVFLPEDIVNNTLVYKVSAQDPDVIDLQLQYTIVGISPGNTGFSIDGSGGIFTAMAFDYEGATKSYTVSVRVQDHGGLAVLGNVKVYITNVNDNGPTLNCTFIGYSAGTKILVPQNSTSSGTAHFKVDEELSIGTLVAACAASDVDLMNDLTFRLQPDNPLLSISTRTGSVLTAARMDVESDGFVPLQSFAVMVCDGGGRCTAIPATLEVLPINDVPPYCYQYFYNFIRAGSIPANTTVASLNCFDGDKPPDALHYTPYGGPLGPGQLFQQVTGSPMTIQVTRTLDFNDPAVVAAEHVYQIMIVISDSTSPVHNVTATVVVEVTAVNEFTPVFESLLYKFNVLETSVENYKIGSVRATDADYPLNCVSYTIASGDSQRLQRFWIDPATGTIELMTSPDAETVREYNLTVQARDCGPVNVKSTSTMVQIEIIPENDKKPVCIPATYKSVIFDNITVGTPINMFRLSCKDFDSANEELRYEIISGNVNNHFGFDPSRGSSSPKLILKSPFSDADMQDFYHLVVFIIDDNVKVSKPRTGSVLLDISVRKAATPAPPTTSYYHRRGLTLLTPSVNSYEDKAWYVPLLLTLMALFFVALVAFVCYLVWRSTGLKDSCCLKAPKRIKVFREAPRKDKMKTVTEIKKYNTVFDGEAVDPVTGNSYKYNSRSGARRWKDPIIVREVEEDGLFKDTELSMAASAAEKHSELPSVLKK